MCNEEIKQENKKEKAVLFFKVGLVRIREGSELGSLPYAISLIYYAQTRGKNKISSYACS